MTTAALEGSVPRHGVGRWLAVWGAYELRTMAVMTLRPGFRVAQALALPRLLEVLLGVVLLHVGGALVQQGRAGGVLRWMVPFLGGEAPGSERGAR